ncbi:MAG: energy-coupling factor ABC transporter permease [Candidatus Marinimicrobia bacterium]|nr:energy-coupling factor ABC transporter permease [Candidatus Neomarinimicrobiota bacterium]MCF7829983.1 energy-coupling factor ABC transporter permease [Candidatus Neomarinimicrobiota bacterium]MCF7881863.1 energy-coupling factor ABC transporter permease [Candidatus Neomarinimicrobiota bacterium]
MHIPDGFLDAKTLITTNAISLTALFAAVKKVNAKFSPHRIPLMGVLASFAFAAQLLAFPVIGGTSAHITGAVLLAVILGPYTAVVLIATVLLLQSLLFQHGGILTFGANLLNLGVIGAMLGYGLYRIRRTFWMAGMAAFIVIVLGGAAGAIELAASDRLPLDAALTGMISAQGIVGIIEAFVTVSILRVIQKIRPDLLTLDKI